MSKKKTVKRHANSSAAAKHAADEARLADKKDRSKNRMDPTARTLMLGDLVFLAVCQMLYDNGMMSEWLSNATTVLGAILMIVALWLQFGGGKKNGAGRLK